MYLVRNKFTKDYIDKNGDWTQKKEMAKRFSTNAEARSYINSESEGVMKYVYPQQMEIIKESATMKTFKQYLKEDWWDNLGPEGQEAYIKAHPNSSKAKTPKSKHTDIISKIKSFIPNLLNKSKDNKDLKDDDVDADYNNVKKSLSNKLGTKKYQAIEDFISDYDVSQFEKAATCYANKYANGPDEIEDYLDSFDDEYEVSLPALSKKIKNKFGIVLTDKDISSVLNKVGGKVKITKEGCDMKTFREFYESKKIVKEDKVYVFVAPYGNTMDVVKGEMQSTGGFKHTDSKFNYNRFPNEKPDATKSKLKSMGFKDSDIVIIQESATDDYI